MFSKQQAKAFLNDLLENVWQTGLVDRIPEFYSEDCIGHLRDSTFTRDDIVERMTQLHQNTEKFHGKILDFHIIDDLIVFYLRQNWVMLPNKDYCEHLVVGTYRIKNNLVSEVWLITSESLPTYVETNQQIVESLSGLSVKTLSRKSFDQQLEYCHNAQDLKLNENEKSCLYHYLKGLSAKEIAKELDLSFRTIETYIARVKQKFDCSTRSQLRNKIFTYGPSA